MSRFLVTGGCGFIGSHLVEYLIRVGHKVVVIDDLSSGYRHNIERVQTACDLIICRVESFDFDSLNSFDGVFHLAAQASVPYSVENFFESSTTNVLSTLKIINYCSKNDTPLIYASSSAVYGNLALGDEVGKYDLLTPYATDKLIAELYAKMANNAYNLKSYGLRFFNVYGPRQDPSNPYSGVISIFIDRLLTGKSIIINGGHQTRDFIFVDDVIVGILASYKYLLKNPTSTYSNLLTGTSISINNLADILMNLTNSSVERIYHELQPGDPVSSLGTTQRMVKQLQLPQMTNLETGLKKTINWLRENYA